MAVAGGLAWWVGNLLGAPYPTFAELAVLISLQGNPYGSLRMAGQRLVGVVGGVAIGVAALRLPGPAPWTIGLLMLLALAVGSRLRFAPTLNTQVAISAILLLAVGHGWHYGLERLWETAVGGAVAVVASLALWPVHPLRECAGDLRRLRAGLATSLCSLGPAFAGDRRPWRFSQIRVRAMAAQQQVAEFPALEEALRWNPWRDVTDVRRLKTQGECVAALYRHARTLARIAVDARAQRPPARLGTKAQDALGSALEAFAAASAALVGEVSAPRARDLLNRADPHVAVVAHGTEPEPVLAAAVGSELGHIAADLRAWLAKGEPEGVGVTPV